MLQYLADGVVLGATLALGAIGLTLTYNVLNFANFAHGAVLAWGAYFGLVFVAALAGWHAPVLSGLGFGWSFIAALVGAAVLAAALANVLDWLVFRPLRRHGVQVALVFASFGASLLLRNAIVAIWGPDPRYYFDAIQISRQIFPGVRVTSDALFVVAAAVALVVALHVFLTRTRLGKTMRALADNPTLAQVSGIDTRRTVGWTWALGAALAAVGGMLYGLTVQIEPDMGFNLLLPLFAAAILGGIGSVYGAVLGGLIIGIAQDVSVAFLAPSYKPAVGFAIMLLVLLVRPQGILGEKK